ncbi:MAG: 3-deoxy-D-manno-octulosonic acid transferase [Sedimentisphaerales bacterium]|nr:3-deoxy-D-manno-octulosonic acid transferase [Sedimentisphaerales bacterium]
MKFVIDLFYLLAIILISPKVIYRMIFHERYRGGFRDRFGCIKRLSPDKKSIWIHAVSVGEVNATRTIVARLKQVLPDHEIVISSTTDTGYARAKALYNNELKVFYFPFDLYLVMSKAFKNIKPDICLLMELEVWPNFTHIANKLSVPVVVVNGRLSDKSFPRYKLIKSLTKHMFKKVDLFLAQTSEYANRFIELGACPEKVIVTNSLKYDTAQITDKIEGADELTQQLNLGPEPFWVAGGTGPSEEGFVLDIFTNLKKEFNDLRMAIVPRKPERFNETANLIEQSKFTFARLSKVKSQKFSSTEKADIILGDTMGDLKKFYSLADIVFVGRSLTPMGGSDMMEPTALGKCTIFGPYTFNFKQTVEALLAGKGAIEVKNPAQLLDAVKKCLLDKNFRQNIANNGKDVIRQNQGATKKSVDEIMKLLNR